MFTIAQIHFLSGSRIGPRLKCFAFSICSAHTCIFGCCNIPRCWLFKFANEFLLVHGLTIFNRIVIMKSISKYHQLKHQIWIIWQRLGIGNGKRVTLLKIAAPSAEPPPIHHIWRFRWGISSLSGNKSPSMIAIWSTEWLHCNYALFFWFPSIFRFVLISRNLY